MARSTSLVDDTPSPYRRLRVLRHDGPCGRREPCWREDCRERFPDYSTIEVLDNATILAYCHAGTGAPSWDALIAGSLL